VVIDMQHGIIDFQSAAELLQAISTKAPVPIARTP
jgi:2-keto-3-deoxy-L-rhamnonate aldolase RhmA